MGLKKKGKRRHRGIAVESRPKGASRSSLVEQIVVTDSSFSLHSTAQGERQFWTGPCIHCSTTLCVFVGGVTDATVEHIVPVSAGGSATDLMNVALACAACNNEKGVRHDPLYPRDARAAQVVHALLAKRASRFRSQ